MLRFREFLREEFYHGSPTGSPGHGMVHVGTHEAAKQALEARIGVPADGKGWDGTREYGKTKLAGQHTMKKMGHYPTGHNVGAPDHDYYPHEVKHRAKFSDGSPVEDHHKPAIHKYHLNGPMSNSPQAPHTDTKANALAKTAVKKGNAKRGYFYKNDGEDSGSISAVVPHHFLKRADA